MSQFAYQSDANGSGANALKAHIDAIAASIPSSSGGAGPAGAAAGSASGSAAAPTASSQLELGKRQRFRTPRHLGPCRERAAALGQDPHHRYRRPPHRRPAGHVHANPHCRRRNRSRRCRLAVTPSRQQADSSNGAALKGVRDQFDTLAWLFKQTAAILRPAEPGRRAARSVSTQPQQLARQREESVPRRTESAGSAPRDIAGIAGSRVRGRGSMATRSVPLRAGAAATLSVAAGAKNRSLGAGRGHCRLHLRHRAGLARHVCRPHHRRSSRWPCRACSSPSSAISSSSGNTASGSAIACRSAA